jgi:cyclohexanecarboxyl-CoA dehydrogenase
MDFTVDDDQLALIESARRFAKQKLAPGYRAGDKSGRVDRTMVKAMGEHGLSRPQSCRRSWRHGCGLRDQRPAAGTDCLRRLQRVLHQSAHLPVRPDRIATHARRNIAREWLDQVITGDKLVAIALTEPAPAPTPRGSS